MKYWRYRFWIFRWKIWVLWKWGIRSLPVWIEEVWSIEDPNQAICCSGGYYSQCGCGGATHRSEIEYFIDNPTTIAGE